MQRQVTKRQVQVIEARIPSGLMQSSTGQMVRKKVAAYARVSTEHEEQQSSYEAQVDYYTRMITGRSDWEFVEVYTEMLTPSLIQLHTPLHPDCTLNAPRAESWVHLSHFRSLSRVHFGSLGAPSRESRNRNAHMALRARD